VRGGGAFGEEWADAGDVTGPVVLPSKASRVTWEREGICMIDRSGTIEKSTMVKRLLDAVHYYHLASSVSASEA
jgi:hypothetical protein